MPNGTNRSLWGNTRGTISSGLPEISGSFNANNGQYARGDDYFKALGAFSFNGNSTGGVGNAGYGGDGGNILFSAKKSNSIYGTTTYVRPQSIGVRFIVKY